MEKISLKLYLMTHTKIKSRRIINSNVKTRNVRFLWEKLRQYICDTGLSKDILEHQKYSKRKIPIKSMSLKLESTASKDTIKKLTIKPWIRKYIFNVHMIKYIYPGYIWNPYKSTLKCPPQRNTCERLDTSQKKIHEWSINCNTVLNILRH